jgi:protein involved in polysaccharide export with SLBB domain
MLTPHLKPRPAQASLVLAGLLAALFILPGTNAQEGTSYNVSNQESATARKNRAAQEAEEKVSLSADKIVEILRDEPGLLLQVKKLLVMKAYEQGRILDPKDLTDEALFRLLREDDNIRVLATREIEDRYYVRVKPSREEIERENELDARRGVTRTSQSNVPDQTAQSKSKTNQEDTYWSKHANQSGDYSVPNAPADPYSQPQSYPTNPQTPEPQNPAPDNPARQVDRASLQQNIAQPNLDVFQESGGIDVGSLRAIMPEELPGLLSVNSGSSTATLSGGIEARAGMMGSSPFGSSSFDRNLLPNLPDQSSAQGMDFPSRMPQKTQQSRLEYPQRTIPSPADLNEDRPQIRRRPNPYADVPSLYDLYAQVAQRPAVLERFGTGVFRNRTGTLDNLPMDMPVGPDYILGPGDGLSIELSGSISQHLQRLVDREGRVALPEIGALPVSGRSVGDVQHLMQAALRTQFHDIDADVSVARIRSVRVYVVGDVESPGAYDISSLSTPLNALYAAGGPTLRGSLRHLRQYRGKTLVQEVDAYDLLLHGIHTELARIQSGDTILVSPVGPEVTVEGMVQRPAIYELAGEKSLSEVLELAGGVLPSGTLRHVDLERLVAHESRSMLRLDLPESNDPQAVSKVLDEFQVQDGDKIRISPILPYADKTVYVDGHVFHPGKYPYHEGMKVTDLLQSYSDLLPEPSRRHAEIIRLQAPDYTPMVLAFNLGDAMAGRDQNLVLKPFDTIRVFGRYDFEDPPVITVSGAVRDPGDHITNGETHLRDAVYLAGGVNPDAELGDAQVFRKTEDGKLKVFSVDLGNALTGEAADNVLLQPKDRVFVHFSQTKLDPPAVLIQGEVPRPGKYPLGEGMTAADLVHIAGGFKRGAYTETADLTHYELAQGTNVTGENVEVPIAKALAGEADSDVRLHDGDVLTIRQLAGWNDVQATIEVKGEVLHPGTYGIKEGEKLSSIIARAGGFRGDAYPYGAIFERTQVRDLEEKNRSELIREVQSDGATLKLIPDTDGDQKMAKEAALGQWQTTIRRLQDTPPAGRLVIHISKSVKRWANTSSDVEVRAGDSIYVPKRPNMVMVDGSVYNPTAVSFKPGKSGDWYLKQAGGPTNMANKKAIFVIRADGSVVGNSGGLFSGGIEKTALQPGDMVVVPEKAFSGTQKWKATLDAAQLIYAVGIAIQLGRSF